MMHKTIAEQALVLSADLLPQLYVPSLLAKTSQVSLLAPVYPCAIQSMMLDMQELVQQP